MAKRPARPRDPNQMAKLIVDMATGEVPNDSHAKPSRRSVGGLKGGSARAAKLSAIMAAGVTEHVWSLEEIARLS